MSRRTKLFFVYGGFAFYDIEHFLDFVERRGYVFSDEKTTPEKRQQLMFTKAELEQTFAKKTKGIGKGARGGWQRLPANDRYILANLKKGTHFGKGIPHRKRLPLIVEDLILTRLFFSGDMLLPHSFDYVSDVDKVFIMAIYDLDDMKRFVNAMLQNPGEKRYSKNWIAALEFFTQDYKYFGRKRVCKLVDITKSLASQIKKVVK